MPAPVTTDSVWRALDKQIFAVLGFVTPAGEARSAGIVYVVRDRKLYIGTELESWKARHIAQNPHVAITVPIAKRVPLLPWIKVPAATITFSGTAEVLPFERAAEDVRRALFRGLELEADFADKACIIEVTPRRDFVTYGVDVPLMTMRNPAKAHGRAPVDAPGS